MALGLPRSNLGGEGLCVLLDSRDLGNPGEGQEKATGEGAERCSPPPILCRKQGVQDEVLVGGWGESWGVVLAIAVGLNPRLGSACSLGLECTSVCQGECGAVGATPRRKVRVGVEVRCGCWCRSVGNLGWVKLGCPKVGKEEELGSWRILRSMKWGCLSLGVWAGRGAHYVKWCLQEGGFPGVPAYGLRGQVYQNDVRVQMY